MMTKRQIVRAAIRWYTIGHVVSKTEKAHAATGAFNKASAYVHVLQLSYSTQCGKESVQNLEAYARDMANAYIASGRTDLSQFMDDNLKTAYWRGYKMDMRAQRRYHMQNDTHMVEFPYTGEGHAKILTFRKANKEFKRRHIIDTLQGYPSQIVCGTVYSLT